MSLRINIKAKIDDRYRLPNEDSLVIDDNVGPVCQNDEITLTIDSSDNQLHFCAVSDGATISANQNKTAYCKESAGKKAAITCLNMVKQVYDGCRTTITNQLLTADNCRKKELLREVCYKMADQANEMILRMNQDEMKGVCTLALIVWSNNNYCLANIGGSPIYLYRNKKITMQSRLDAEQKTVIRANGEKVCYNKLTRYLGMNLKGRQMVYLTDGEFLSEDIIVLCTDGLNSILPDNNIQSIIERKAFSKALSGFWKVLDYNLQNAHRQDNCTVILLKAEENQETPTVYVNQKLAQVEDGKSMDDFWKKYGMSQSAWPAYISDIIQLSGVSKKEITNRMHTGLKNIPDWLKKDQIPAKRDYLIYLGIACGLGRNQIDKMLQKASFYQLYDKDLHDAVLIFMIEHKVWKPGKEKSIADVFQQKYQYALECQVAYIQRFAPSENPEDTVWVRHMIKDPSHSFNQMLEELFHNNTNQYREFMEYMNPIILKSVNIADFYCSEGIRLRYYKAADALRRERRIPSRIMLIAFAAQMNFTLKKTNALLTSAGMKELYAKDPVENIIIFLLSDLYKNDPEYEDETGMVNLNKVRYSRLIKSTEEMYPIYESVDSVAAYLEYSIKEYVHYLENRCEDSKQKNTYRINYVEAERDRIEAHQSKSHAECIKRCDSYIQLMELFDIDTEKKKKNPGMK